MRKVFVLILVVGVFVFAAITDSNAQIRTILLKGRASERPEVSTGVKHIIWVWFENEESTSMTAATAPFFTSFATANVKLASFFGVSHPSQPNYLDAFSGSNQGVTNDNHINLPAATDNLAKQMATAGKAWRIYVQGYPGNCSDVDTFAGGVDGPGVAGQYARKHNPAISFDSVRLDPVQCANIQPLANFDPTVDFAFVTPNMINDMHDPTNNRPQAITQGDTFLQAFVPLVKASPDWNHTLLIVTFDEGETNTNGGGQIYTAAAAAWLAPASVATTYNHFSVLRTIEDVYGLPSFLGGAANATTMTEILPAANAVSVSGHVFTATNQALRNAVVSITNNRTGLAQTVLSSAFGNYQFDNLLPGDTYTVTATSKHYRFLPQTMQVNANLTGVDFTGDE